MFCSVETKQKGYKKKKKLREKTKIVKFFFHLWMNFIFSFFSILHVYRKDSIIQLLQTQTL